MFSGRGQERASRTIRCWPCCARARGGCGRALAFLEAAADRFIEALAGADFRLISAPSALEAAIVAGQRAGMSVSDHLDDLMGRIGLEIDPITVTQV